MILKQRQRRTCVSRIAVLNPEGEERTSKLSSVFEEYVVLAAMIYILVRQKKKQTLGA
jgi:hypothetical protein